MTDDLLSTLNNANAGMNAANIARARRQHAQQQNDIAEALGQLPENSNIHIHVDGNRDEGREGKKRGEDKRDYDPGKLSNLSMRSIIAWGAGLVSGAAAWFTGHMYAQDKMLAFEADYRKISMDIITGKGGVGASIADAGMSGVPHGLMGNGFGNFGSGLSAPLIEEAVATNLIKDHPEKYNFAKWMRRIGGKSTFGMGVGLAAGATVGLVTYAALSHMKEKTVKKDDEDWQTKVETDKDKPRTLE